MAYIADTNPLFFLCVLLLCFLLNCPTPAGLDLEMCYLSSFLVERIARLDPNPPKTYMDFSAKPLAHVKIAWYSLVPEIPAASLLLDHHFLAYPQFLESR
jgi:hypothetical protein